MRHVVACGVHGRSPAGRLQPTAAPPSPPRSCCAAATSSPWTKASRGRRPLAVRGDRIVAVGTDARGCAADRAGHPGDRSRGTDRHSRVHRGPRPLHGTRPVADGDRPDGHDQLRADRVDGRRRREGREAGRLDPGPRLAPGEVDLGSLAQRRGLSAARRAQQGVARTTRCILEHASGHAVFANAKAMEVAGVTAKTANPPGGEILKDKAGRPIGVFRETASDLIDKALGAWQAAQDTGTARGRRAPGDRAGRRRRRSRKASPASRTRAPTSRPLRSTSRWPAKAGSPIRLWVMVRDSNERLRERLAAGEGRRHGRQPPDGRRHQGHGRRRARLAGRLAARAVRRLAGQHRAQHDARWPASRRPRPSPWRTACSSASTPSATARTARC